MTRNIITELVIRLLAIWLFITSIGSFLLNFRHLKSAELPFFEYIASFSLIIAISILLIIFSKQISKIIWIGRQNDEIITNRKERDTFDALISILGLYFIIYSLSRIIHHLAEIWVIIPAYSGASGIYAVSINQLTYNGITLVFGILLFSFPEGIMSIRITIKNFLTKRRSNGENPKEKE